MIKKLVLIGFLWAFVISFFLIAIIEFYVSFIDMRNRGGKFKVKTKENKQFSTHSYLDKIYKTLMSVFYMAPLKERKWFKKLIKTRGDFYNLDNLISFLKLKYGKINHLVEWMIGVSIIFLFSIKISSLLGNPVGIPLYILAFLLLAISIFLFILFNFRQISVMRYLYLEKDKEEKLRKKFELDK